MDPNKPIRLKIISMGDAEVGKVRHFRKYRRGAGEELRFWGGARSKGTRPLSAWNSGALTVGVVRWVQTVEYPP